MDSRTRSPGVGSNKHDKGNEKTSRPDIRSSKKNVTDEPPSASASKLTTKSKSTHDPTGQEQYPFPQSDPRGAGVHISASSARPCKEHTTLTNVADVRQMEKGLLKLLEDFHSGKLQVFGQDCSFEKMDHVREQQERLARRHFEIDSRQELRGFDTPESRKHASENMSKLMDSLQDLCTSIQHLQKEESKTNTSASGTHV